MGLLSRLFCKEDELKSKPSLPTHCMSESDLKRVEHKGLYHTQVMYMEAIRDMMVDWLTCVNVPVVCSYEDDRGRSTITLSSNTGVFCTGGLEYCLSLISNYNRETDETTYEPLFFARSADFLEHPTQPDDIPAAQLLLAYETLCRIVKRHRGEEYVKSL